MALKLLPNGIGGATGADLATQSPYIGTGTVWYVGPGGSNTNYGLQRTSPFATTTFAHTSAAAGDTIVWLPGHKETFTAQIVCNKAGITFVSEGLGSDRAQLTCGAFVTMFNVSAACVRLVNVNFPASITVGSSTRIVVTGAGFRMQDVDMVLGALDFNDSIALSTGASHAVFESCTFTAASSGASVPLNCSGATLTGLTLIDVTFDGGGFNWNVTNGEVFTGGVITGLYVTGLRLLNGSNFGITSASTTAALSMSASSGESIVHA